jgi:signal transduction histidine kinase
LTNIERHVVDKAGRDHALLINVKQVAIGQGRLLYTCRDATRRLHHEKMLLKYQNRLRSLAAALSMAEERERRKLATALHDVIGQELVATSMKLQSLRPAVPDDHHAMLDEATELLSRAIRNSRDLTFEISPPVLYEFGLVAALEWLGERYADQYDLDIRMQAEGPADELPDELTVALFQSARELLNNVTRHAEARTVRMKLTCGADAVTLAVSDDGIGFEDDTVAHTVHEPQGYGLFSIRERLGHLGGDLSIRSRSGKGTQVTLELPRQLIQAEDREANHEYQDRVG